jgi:hypothetical protein
MIAPLPPHVALPGLKFCLRYLRNFGTHANLAAAAPPQIKTLEFTKIVRTNESGGTAVSLFGFSDPNVCGQAFHLGSCEPLTAEVPAHDEI